MAPKGVGKPPNLPSLTLPRRGNPPSPIWKASQKLPEGKNNGGHKLLEEKSKKGKKEPPLSWKGLPKLKRPGIKKPSQTRKEF